MKKRMLLFLMPFIFGNVMAQDPVQIKYASEITKESSYKHMVVFTSDELAGRGAGEVGAERTVVYIEEEFKKAGLAPGVNGSYFQPVKLAKSTFEVKNFTANGKALQNGKDFYMSGNAPETKLNVRDVVFVGYGISDAKYDDLAGVDIEGKVVLVINEGEPMDAQGNSLITGTKETSDWSAPRSNKRMQAIMAKNPKMILATSSQVSTMLERMGSRLSRPRISLEQSVSGANQSAPVIVNITTEAANQILSRSKNTIEDLKNTISSTKKPASKKLKANIATTYGMNIQKFEDQNVIGIVEGSDKKNEYVVVMGHYDHDGVMADGTVLRGADDNASGTIGMMEIAKAFAKAKKDGHGPRRTMIFIALAAEEKGLLGSEYYVENPVFPLENTVSALNMDMIGRIDDKHLKENHNYIHVMGADKLSSELHEINYNANATYTHMELDTTYNDPKDPQRLYYRSDHYNFAKKGIPSIFYFSGLHPDYHTPRDVIEKIDFDMMVKRAKLVYHTAWELANREKRIVVDSNKP